LAVSAAAGDDGFSAPVATSLLGFGCGACAVSAAGGFGSVCAVGTAAAGPLRRRSLPAGRSRFSAVPMEMRVPSLSWANPVVTTRSPSVAPDTSTASASSCWDTVTGRTETVSSSLAM
jgi:hypothetical protein